MERKVVGMMEGEYGGQRGIRRNSGGGGVGAFVANKDDGVE